MKGSTIQVELNGTRILDADLSKVTEFMGKHAAPRARTGRAGTSASAGHNDPVAFRNVGSSR